uniref:CHITINASE-RELATED AGGLUTININ n=1 Tax=Robinia pseudoacacia TaxID=35938 RepID=UPI0005CF9260|nr:Chain A, CHITINASE-RELATED AGGLUTININ [Robinia pseudoacacia]4URI_B Chain B, CHITINASE-RELATED AGGLUTININ [Robinia pseudoacacia]
AIKGGYWYSGSGLAVSDINPSHFTHLFCAFADLDPNTNKLTISSSNAAAFSTFTQTVRAKNPSVKTLLSIGGGGGRALAAVFANMASQASRRKSFIDSSIQLARRNNFHGLDLDWEYPSSDIDKTNFASLIREWRAAVATESSTSGTPALLLSAAVGGSDQITPLKYYPGEAIANNLDWVNVMTYDLYTSDSYPTLTQPPAPLFYPRGIFSADEGITKWIQSGVPESKLALGLPFYGFKWRLSDPNNHGLFAPATQGLGAVKYKDIVNTGGQVEFDSTYVTNYRFKGTDWYGYDDTQSISAKVAYAKQRGLFGYFAWHIEQDSNWALSETASRAWGT